MPVVWIPIGSPLWKGLTFLGATLIRIPNHRAPFPTHLPLSEKRSCQANEERMPVSWTGSSVSFSVSQSHTATFEFHITKIARGFRCGNRTPILHIYIHHINYIWLFASMWHFLVQIAMPFYLRIFPPWHSTWWRGYCDWWWKWWCNPRAPFGVGLWKHREICRGL